MEHLETAVADWTGGGTSRKILEKFQHFRFGLKMDMVVVSPQKVLKSNIPTVAYVQLSQHLVHLRKDSHACSMFLFGI